MTHPVPPQRGSLKWAAIDVDGTIAEPVWTAQSPTSAIGQPIREGVEKVLRLWEAGYSIVLWTSRPWSDHEALQLWADWHIGTGVVSQIVCAKLLAAVYVDDRAVHAEHPDWLAALKEINS